MTIPLSMVGGMNLALDDAQEKALFLLFKNCRDLEKRLQELDDQEMSQKAELKKQLGEKGNENFAQAREGESTLVRDMKLRKTLIDGIKEGMPEGFADDDPCQYFIAISDLLDSIRELEELKIFIKRTLEAQCERDDSLRSLIDKLDKIQIRPLQPSKECNPDPSSELSKLDADTRSVKKFYREMKNFLGPYLDKIAPESADLSFLLQSLWDTFIKKGSDEWVSISHLDFDVEPASLVLLKRAGVIEESNGLIRLVDFASN